MNYSQSGQSQVERKKLNLAPLIGAALFCIIWEDLIILLEVPIYVIPAPSDVLGVALDSSTRMLLFNATIQTGSAALLGFLIAVGVGVLTGTLLASVRVLRVGVYPLANLLQMVPIIAIAPLLNIWFGYGVLGVAASATIVSIFPIIANTVDGLRSVDPQLIELFNIYGATPKQRWRRLEIPAALPQIFTGFRVAAGLAVIGAVVGELVSGVLKAPPIGAVIASNLRTGKLDIVFAAIACSALVGFSLFGLVSWAGQTLMGQWNSTQQRDELDTKLSPRAQRRELFLITGILATVIFLTLSAVMTSSKVSPLSSDSHSAALSSIEEGRLGEGRSVEESSGEERSGETDSPPVKVRLQLNWMPEPEFGGIYEVKRLGLDREEGIDLQIITGGPGTPSAQLVAQRKLEFGVMDSTQIMTMRAKGAPLVGIYASFKTDPRAIITHFKGAPASLRELWKSDRLLAVEPGSLFMKWLSHHYGESALTWVSTQGGLTQFKLNPELSQGVYIFSEPVTLKLDQVETKIFPISESGFNPYAVLISTHEDIIKQRPELIRSMYKILQEGWSSYLKDPAPTNRMLSQLNTSMSFEAMQMAVEYAKPFIQSDLTHQDPSSTSKLGEMSLERWKRMREQLRTLKVLEEDQKVDPKSCFWRPVTEVREVVNQD